jgi:hypothetical protein
MTQMDGGGETAVVARDKASIIADVCTALSDVGVEAATRTLHREYKFDPEPITKRKYGPLESTRIFVRDGFIDRYTGSRVVFPPVFRLLSSAMPQDFPYHPAWKTDLTHPAYWELGATIDHLVPVTRGGRDDESNWMTASMASNSAKMNWTLKELGWELHPPGSMNDWDGLLRWFLQYAASHAETMSRGRLLDWYRAARRVVETEGPQ